MHVPDRRPVINVVETAAYWDYWERHSRAPVPSRFQTDYWTTRWPQAFVADERPEPGNRLRGQDTFCPRRVQQFMDGALRSRVAFNPWCK